MNFPVNLLLNILPGRPLKRTGLGLLLGPAMFLLSCIPGSPAAAGGTGAKYVMSLGANWEISGGLPASAMLISLQGVANIGEPRLYFRYPPGWDYTFCDTLLEYYRSSRGMQFTELSSPEEALDSLARYAKGYVVWDRNVRTSLIVAFTAAGINRAVVVTEDLIPLAERHGLKMVEDFRGRFFGLSDASIYVWAYEKYWRECNKNFLVYLGGESGNIMKPGIADFGIHHRCFFTDASTNPRDALEYAFASHLFGELKPLSIVIGWHSYAKDLEAQHVTLASRFGLRVEGLHTLPNMSFNHQIPLSPGYHFRNNHNVRKGQSYVPQKKVYIACIQTDCLGLGAWTKPGRGEIPYAWEVTMNWSWLAPAMLQYFYDMATPNDYFLGALSGPGYMYPKAIPAAMLPPVVDTAYALMKTLDLNVFEIMDHSSYWTSGGIDDDLPKDIVDVYFDRMPDILGIVNGYRPGHTFAVYGERPFISYDYYLGEKRDEAEAAADLEELANLNPARPYFLLLHVREWSDIKRVRRILDRLGEGFEVVPLDLFLTLAGKNPTYRERFSVPPAKSPE
ncbi:MAG TPA: GxGYxYP domain-containing protein [Bacteroidota bacterium]|nr:GxGYxYP domain-containing protein [Bacteroidota bacterium]